MPRRALPSCQWADEPQLFTNPDLFLDRLTTLYGPSNSGKTVYIRALVQLLGPVIPEGIFFSGTEKSFAEIPAPYVHEKITEELLQKIWDRQGVRAEVFRRATNPEVLQRLAARAPDPQHEAMLRKIEVLRSNERARMGGESAAFERFSERCDELRRQALQYHIKCHRSALARQRLPDDELHSLRYVDFNPRCLVVFDDVSPQLKKLKTKPIVGEYFTRARHRFLTVVVGLHDDKYIDSELRKNAHISIFTSPEMIQVFVRRDCMGLSADVKKKAQQIAADPRAFANFSKILYLRDRAEHPFVRTRVRKINKGALRFGSAMWREMGLRVASTGTVDPGNQFLSEFGLAAPAQPGAPARV